MKPSRKPSGASRLNRADRHIPVLREDIVRLLTRPRAVLIDATVGDGGHAEALLTACGPDARLLGIDLDLAALAESRHRLQSAGDRVRLVHGSFADLARLARAEGFDPATGILFDLGLRSAQLDASRGFSFQEDAALDMRFDSTGRVRLPLPEHPALKRLDREVGAYTAAHVVQRLRPDELADVLQRYGEERFAPRIANAIVRARREHALATTSDLAAVVVHALPPAARHGRIHAATRTFQALRIAVNREFESLKVGLADALEILAPNGILVVLSYHSGEDRIVKTVFRDAVGGGFTLVGKKPRIPTRDEQGSNPRSRSAKLRALHSTS